MPNRVIKDSIHTSESVNLMSDFQFRLWVNLITYVDDYGRGDARPAVIRGACFPLRERLTNDAINAALQALASIGCVSLYSVEGRPYLYFPQWESHQSIRNKRSKFPEPPPCDSNLRSIACNCIQLNANVPVIQSNPIQSESESNPNPTRARTREAGDFDRFWESYPRKVGKAAAKTVFAKIKVPVDVLISAVERQKRSEQWTREYGRFIPHPVTWLRQGRWEDEVDGKEARNGSSGNVDEHEELGIHATPLP